MMASWHCSTTAAPSSIDLLDAGSTLFLELDLGWVWYAGLEPLALLEGAGARAPLVHVKDMRKDDGPVHVPLGAGDIDYGRSRDSRASRSRVADRRAGRDGRPGFDDVAVSLAELHRLRGAVAA